MKKRKKKAAASTTAKHSNNELNESYHTDRQTVKSEIHYLLSQLRKPMDPDHRRIAQIDLRNNLRLLNRVEGRA
jgi:hypothetical protein